MVHGHGDDFYNFKQAIEMNFSAIVNPVGTSKLLLDHLKANIHSIGTYPEPNAGKLAHRIESAKSLQYNSVIVTNGSVGGIYLIAQFLHGKKSLIYTPCFSEYADACLLNKHNVEYRKYSEFPVTSLKGVGAVWLANPNNPDGKMYDITTIKNLARDNQETYFIIDESYADFIANPKSLNGDIAKYRNIICFHSLTKPYAIPGLRLGYVVCHRELREELEKLIIPWNINTLAIKAGIFCLSEEYKDESNIAKLIYESNRVQFLIQQVEGFSVEKSETIFFLVKTPVSGTKIKEYLVEKQGILVRDASNFKDLDKNYIRVSIKSYAENNKLVNALEEWNNTRYGF